MKSIEEKAKAYDEALEKIHQFIDGYCSREISKEKLEDIFPELKESEYEKTRKEILDYIIKSSESCYDVQQYGKEKFEKWIAWLKKQGEQKPINKIEPKFKIGDWITNNLCTWKIESIKDEMYYTNYKGIDVGGDIESIDKQYHLWTIQDAKDGNVLTYSDSRNNVWVCIFKEYTNERVYDYCTLDKESFWEHGNCNYLASFSYTPATKEQCDQLKKAMTNAGYKWNKEECKLEKI